MTKQKGAINLGIQVVEKEEMKVVGLSWTGTYSQVNTIPSLFIKMEERLGEVGNKTDEPIFIAPFHSRETEFTYYVTKPVERIDDVPDGMVGFTIPSKNYVFTIHKGKQEEVEHTYERLYTWMKEYGYEQDHQALSLEIYKEVDPIQYAAGDLYIEIYLPIKTYKS